ncbi:protein kinase domain-containing protein [Streptomyces sp. MS191]|uniref:protein kinase domain-containing protein n=1 Tax=Streptomyces sp. ms191 TaxID=1827978 RepID=UPI00164F5314|nr:protein kinase [Streptomyces sp. ms191]
MPGDPASVGDGRYQLTHRLGQGGMGVVYLGRSPSGRAVAVKVVRPELSTEPGFRRRFADEVAAAQRVSGFHTAPVVDADPEGDPAWLVTAFVPGPTLAAVLDRVGALPADTLTVLAAGLAEALDSIHRAGVVHRDLKPANIIVAEDGPRVIDFGIARALDGTVLTQTGFQVGTPGFLAPEQLISGTVTPAVDVFALGVVLAQAAGGSPFGDGPSMARHYKIVHEEPDLTAVPDELRALVAECLSKDPADRPAPGDFLRRLTVRHPAGGGWLPDAATVLLPRQDPGRPPATGPGPAAAPGSGRTPGPGPDPSTDAKAAGPGAPTANPSGATAPAVPPHGATAPGATAADAPETAGTADPRTLDPRSTAPRVDPRTGSVDPASAPDARTPAGATGSGPDAGTPAAASSPASASAGPAEEAGRHASPTVTAPGTGWPGAVPGTPGVFGPPDTPAGPGEPGSPGTVAAPPARRRRTPALVAAAALVALSTVGLLVWQSWSGASDGKGGTPSTPTATGPAPFPADSVLIREDTAPGWPQTCHGSISRRDRGTPKPVRLITGEPCVMLPQWSPDRRSFAYTRVDADGASVWRADADGSNARRIAPIAGGRASWSPDGKRLAVLRVKDGVQQLFVVNVADGAAQQLTTGGGKVEDPAWSPDGKQIAVCMQAGDSGWQIHVVDPAKPGGAPRQLTRLPHAAFDPVWSPDGRTFAYTAGKYGQGTQGDIRLVGTDGTDDRALMATPAHEMDPSWSPDGSWVSFVRGPYASPWVWVVRADGSGAFSLSTGAASEAHADWS